MSAGALRDRVDIKQPDTTQDLSGQPQVVYSSVMADVPAQITCMGSGEVGRTDQNAEQVTFEIKTRYYSTLDSITNKWQLVDNVKYGTMHAVSWRRVWERGLEYFVIMARQ